eukprot:jgi/Mesvir1/22001/Mv11643-RA.1
MFGARLDALASWFWRWSPIKEKRKRNNDSSDFAEQQRPEKRLAFPERKFQSSLHCGDENITDVKASSKLAAVQERGCTSGDENQRLPRSFPHRAATVSSGVVASITTCTVAAQQRVPAWPRSGSLDSGYVSDQVEAIVVASADPTIRITGLVSSMLDFTRDTGRARPVHRGMPAEICWSQGTAQRLGIAAQMCSGDCPVMRIDSQVVPVARDAGSAVGAGSLDEAAGGTPGMQLGRDVDGGTGERGGQFELYRDLLLKCNIPVPTAEEAKDAQMRELETRVRALSCTRPSITKALERLQKAQEARELEAREQQEQEEDEQEEEVEPPFRVLTPDELAIVTKALGPGKNDLLTEHQGGGMEITRERMACLRKGQWLNDDVINMYMELLKDRQREWLEAAAAAATANGKKAGKRAFGLCHFFNTFFYNKLCQDKRGYEYKGVQRWTKAPKVTYKLKDCAKVIVPVHQQVHWCLAVINLRDQAFEYYDSMGGRDAACLENLARYIVDEVKDKSGEVLDVSKWERRFVTGIPQQNNG